MSHAAKETSRGVLISCDVPTKEYILHIAKVSILLLSSSTIYSSTLTEAPYEDSVHHVSLTCLLFLSQEHVLHDLDETHLFIDPAGLKFIREKLKQFSEENAYSDPQNEPQT